MRHVRLTGLLIVAVAALAACGSSSDTGTNDTGASDAGTIAASASVDGDVVAVGAAPAPAPVAPGDGVGSIGDAVEVAAGAPGEAGDVACDVDRQTLQTAVETYELLNGALATSQAELVEAQMIREPSVRFDIDPQGAIVPAPGSPCL